MFLIPSTFSLIKVQAGYSPVVVPGSKYAHFPDKTYSTLSYTMKTTSQYLSYTPQILISIDEFVYDPSTRLIFIYVDESMVYSNTFSNDFSVTVNAASLISSGTHTIKIEIYNGAYGDEYGCYKLKYLKIGRLYWTPYEINKYAVFFWQEFVAGNDKSGVISEEAIDKYANKLSTNFGFTIIKHQNPWFWKSKMSDLDALEDSNSIVYIYIAGHGFYDSNKDYSAVRMSRGIWIHSDEFATEVKKLESNRILVMVDSCNCGDFKDKLIINGISVITATDQNHIAKSDISGDYSEPRFSKYFYSRVGIDQPDYGRMWNDQKIFEVARAEAQENWGPYSLASFRSWHSFFGP